MTQHCPKSMTSVHGWPAHGNSLYPAFSVRREQLSVCQGTLMCGLRVVIPSKLHSKMLDILHEGHLGTVKMKNLAHSYMWWPGIDKQIEDLAKACPGCQRNQNSPPLAPLHPWEWPSTPWQRVEFAGPFKDSMFLITVDAHSKFCAFCVEDNILQERAAKTDMHEYWTTVRLRRVSEIHEAEWSQTHHFRTIPSSH